VQQEKQLLQSRYSELNTGFTWAINLATALGVALLFVIALLLTRKRQAAPPPPPPPQTSPPTSVKVAVVLENAAERLVKWPATQE